MMPEENLQRQLDEQWNQLRDLTQKSDRILSYLESDASTGRPGLYEEIKDIDQRLRKVETVIQANLTKKSVLVVLGAGLMWLIVSLDDLIQFFKKFFV